MTPQFLSQLYAYEKWKHVVKQKFVHEIYSNVTHSSQKVEIIWMSINRWKDKQNILSI